jgi:tetratricopeptide (TPR) repeat protein
MPRPHSNWVWYAGGLVVLLLIATAIPSDAGGLMQLAGSLAMLGLVAAFILFTTFTVRAVRMEQNQLQAIEELLQLRRWAEAAAMLIGLLSAPMRSHSSRALALIFLAKAMARFHRWGEVVEVCEHLLSADMLDGDTAHALRLERAMSLLHEDRLFDADRAIAELRRSPQAAGSGGLALVELYRDVKTGHFDDAMARFAEKLPLMRRQLGVRVADAHALVARAHDLLERSREAAASWRKATLLSPPGELARRYAELATMVQRYEAAQAPVEAA